MSDRPEKNVLIAGLGLHSKRIYLPYLHELEKTYNVHIRAIVELSSVLPEIKPYLRKMGLDDTEILLTEPFSADIMPSDLEARLNQVVGEQHINAIVIATEPSAHRPYARWAFTQDLHVLLDKPITTREKAVRDLRQAYKIYEDYVDLLRACEKAPGKTIFSVNVQRRFHPGFEEVMALIRQVRDKTNCPVTSIFSMHCDGQWRLPKEILELDYHGFNRGYGKVSHSGYHFYDLVYQFMRAGYIDDKWPEVAQVFSTFTLPAGFLHQIRKCDYERYFDDRRVTDYSEYELQNIFRAYGEIDAFTDISLIRAGVSIGHISINLLHNSFSRRAWATPNLTNLYKGNGRVKAEFHSIQQGPFQNIQVHCFQAKDKHEFSTRKDHQIGGNNHFDIHIFQNTGMLGTREPYRKISLDSLFEPAAGKLAMEEVKCRVIKEFLDAIDGRISKRDLRSSIEDHHIPVKLMSAIYASHIQRISGHYPIVSFSFDDSSKAPFDLGEWDINTEYVQERDNGVFSTDPAKIRV